MCKVIQGEIVDSGEIITVWIAPDLLYRAKHFEIISPTEKTIVHNTFREYNGGIWFPKHILKKEYYKDNSTGKDFLYKSETLLVKNDLKLNIVLSDDLFEIDFPKGLMVYDYRTGERFEVK